MLIVGLTGGISTGKSTVSATFRENNVIVIDADLIAREVVAPGKSAYNKVVATFGESVPDLVNDDASLNRAALGQAVFGNPEQLAKLNGIVHPAVRWEIARQIFSAYLLFNDLVVLDVPLLFESGLDKICGYTITVSCRDDLQISRLLKRNPELSRDDAAKRIASQMSRADRDRRADLVVENNEGLDELKQAVELALATIRPSRFWTYFNRSPFGLFSAIYTFVSRRVRQTRPVVTEDSEETRLLSNQSS